MSRRTTAFALGSITLASFLACGTGRTTGSESDAGARPAAGPPSVEQACADLYDAITASSACNFQLNAVGDRTRYLTFCTSRFGAAGVPSATLGAAETCAAAVMAAAPTCAPYPHEACAAPGGTLTAGAACGTALQCKSLVCTAAGQTLMEIGSDLTQGAASALYTCGQCADAIPVGGSCQGVNQCTLGCFMQPTPCVAGAMCSATPASPTGKCVACMTSSGPSTGAGFGPSRCAPGPSGSSGGVATGGACNTTADCMQGLVCLNGACTQGRKLGETCAPDDAGTTDCYGAAQCDPKTRVCTAPSFLPPGAPCSAGNYLCASGQCAFNGPSGGACPPLIPDGQPCGNGQPSPGVCEDFAACVSPPMLQGCCTPPAAPAGSAGVVEDAGSPPSGPTCVFFDPRTCH
jgi:hypothetical protein